MNRTPSVLIALLLVVQQNQAMKSFIKEMTPFAYKDPLAKTKKVVPLPYVDPLTRNKNGNSKKTIVQNRLLNYNCLPDELKKKCCLALLQNCPQEQLLKEIVTLRRLNKWHYAQLHDRHSTEELLGRVEECKLLDQDKTKALAGYLKEKIFKKDLNSFEQEQLHSIYTVLSQTTSASRKESRICAIEKVIKMSKELNKHEFTELKLVDDLLEKKLINMGKEVNAEEWVKLKLWDNLSEKKENIEENIKNHKRYTAFLFSNLTILRSDDDNSQKLLEVDRLEKVLDLIAEIAELMELKAIISWYSSVLNEYKNL